MDILADIKIPFLVLLLLSGFSCGLETNYRTISDEGSSIGGVRSLTNAGQITGVEESIAINICYAFRAARGQLVTDFLNKQLDYRVQKSDCQNRTVDQNVTAFVKQNTEGYPYLASGYNQGFISHIENDEKGKIAHVCSKLLKGESSSRYLEQGSTVYEYSFSHANGLDLFQVRSGPKSEGSFVVHNIEKHYVVTRYSSEAQRPYYGLIDKVEKEIYCNSSSIKSTFVQSIIFPNE